jgi:Protein of unknown function (DUF1397)
MFEFKWSNLFIKLRFLIYFLKSKMKRALTCIENALSIEDMLESLGKAMESENYQEIFEKSCQVTNNVLPCLENLSTSFEPCMDNEEKEIIRLLFIVARALVNFGCSRTVDELTSMMNAKEDECFLSKKPAVEICGENLTSFIGQNRNVTEKKILQLLTEEKGCTQLVDFETCVLPLFDECQNRKPIDLMNGLLSSIIDQTPCRGMKSNIRLIEGNDV